MEVVHLFERDVMLTPSNIQDRPDSTINFQLPISYLFNHTFHSVMSTQVPTSELHKPSNDPNTLDIAPGVDLSEVERNHVAVIIDLFQGKGSMAKLKDTFAENGVYEDEFAISGGIEQVGELSSSGFLDVEQPALPSLRV